jgi:hypothetical protein
MTTAITCIYCGQQYLVNGEFAGQAVACPACSRSLTVPVPTGEVELKHGMAFYRGSRPFETLEFPPESEAEASDYRWAMEDAQVQREHGGRVVAVRGRRVWGAGKSYRAAWEQARQVPGCPPLGDLVFVVTNGCP